MSDLYDILGVTCDATQEEIRKAYKSQAGKCHPDKNPDDPEATVKFQALQKAYSILNDPEKRKRYDQTGAEDNVPTLDEAANYLIAQVWLHSAERAGFAARNYLLETTQALQNNLRQCTIDKKKFQNSYNKLEYLISKTEADPFMLRILEVKLQEIKHQKAHAEEATEVMTRALELLDGYKYTGEVPKPKEGGPFPWAMAGADPYIS
jgi:curved DNA-binding protein CbpA